MQVTQKDMVIYTEHNNIDNIKKITLSEENDMQEDVDICQYDSKTLQQKQFLEMHRICNVLLKER